MPTFIKTRAMASFYSNENFPAQAVKILRSMGHDVQTTHDVGNANQRVPDSEVLSYATKSSRCVLTLNRRDFIKLHRESSNHAGIVVCVQDIDFQRLALNVHNAVKKYQSLHSELVKVSRTNG